MHTINELPVVDAKKSVILVIEPKDVKKGDNKNPSSCAAAVACMRQLHCSEVRVHLSRTYIRQGDRWIKYKTSLALRAEIVAFDRGGEFMPGEYVLEPAPRKHGEPGVRTTSGNRKKRRIARMRHYTLGVRPHGANK